MGIRERLGKASMHLIQAGGELVPLPRKLANQRDALNFMHMMSGYQMAAGVAAATQLGLFDVLKEPHTAAEAGARLDMTPEAAQVLIEAVAPAGLVDQLIAPDGVRRYVNSTLARRIFGAKRWSPTDRFSSLRSMVDFMIGSWKYWADLPQVMKKDQDDGHPVLKVYNPDSPLIGNYIETTTTMLAQPFAELVDTLDLSNVRHMICGVVGISAAAAIMKKNPQVDLTVSCLQQLINHLPTALAAYGCKQPVEVVVNTGDATTDRWGSIERFDLVPLIRKFAYCGPQHGIDYLEKSKQCLSPGGYVIIWEPFLDNFRMVPWMGATSALMDSMLGESHPLWTTEQVAGFARQAGYETSIFHCRGGMTSFVVARVPQA
jgi:hypothetical protein